MAEGGGCLRLGSRKGGTSRGSRSWDRSPGQKQQAAEKEKQQEAAWAASSPSGSGRWQNGRRGRGGWAF